MLTFLIVLMPLSIVFYEFVKKEPKDFMPILTGSLTAALYCALKAFFSFSHRVVLYSFGSNFAFYFLHNVFLPLVIVYGLFFVISKDDIDYRIKSFFPLMASFYSVYLPYIVISANQSTVYPYYEILFKPFVFLCMILSLSIEALFIYKEFEKKNYVLFAINIAVTIIFMVIPAVTETLYAINNVPVVRILILIIYCLMPFVYLGFRFVKKENNK